MRLARFCLTASLVAFAAIAQPSEAQPPAAASISEQFTQPTVTPDSAPSLASDSLAFQSARPGVAIPTTRSEHRMSWNFKIVAKSKAGAQAKLADVASRAHGITPTFTAAVAATIEALPEGPVFVESSGHIDTHSGGNGSFVVNQYVDVAD